MSWANTRHNLNVDQEDEEIQAWYHLPTNEHPFKLTRKLSAKTPDAPAYRALAPFPWDSDSLTILWHGNMDTVANQAHWKQFLADYWDAVAVTSDSSLHIHFTQQRKPPLCFELPPTAGGPKLLDVDKMCVAWAMGSQTEPLQPLVVFSQGSRLYVYNVERRGVQGYIRGHGGTITSIAVHPTNPHLICTTSRDYSTRIYDLNLSAEIDVPEGRTIKSKDEKIHNPPWPPNYRPSLAGGAHGLRLPLSEQEGKGLGRCICVLMGGLSGGHTAAVLSAAFHPVFPIIATCGVDRAVKIWAVRPDSPTMIKREDKPLFSSSMIHKSRVVSISWLDDDNLMTHSAPAIMRVDPSDNKNTDTYIETGELTVWRWLALDRFFQAGQEGVPRTALRSIYSDFRESSSFRIISTHTLPEVPTQLQVPSVFLYHTPTHHPLILINYPGGVNFALTNVVDMRPRPRPWLPRDIAERLLGEAAPAVARADAAAERVGVELTQRGPHRARRNTAMVEPDTDTDEVGPEVSTSVGHGLTQWDDALDHDDVDLAEGPPNSDSESDDEGDSIVDVVRRRHPAPPLPQLQGWVMRIPSDGDRRVMATAMGFGGRVIIAVGTGGSLWVWRSE